MGELGEYRSPQIHTLVIFAFLAVFYSHKMEFSRVEHTIGAVLHTKFSPGQGGVRREPQNLKYGMCGYPSSFAAA